MQRALDLRDRGQLPHAVLLETPSSHGMDSLGYQLAGLLLCDNPDGLQICGECEACRLLAAGTYADFCSVTPQFDEKTKKTSKNIKIEQVRELIHTLSLTRHYERLKIAIIYPADSMSIAGANALLKTLEEPAEEVLLVLVTQNPGRVPITLRSRCQRWRIHQAETEQALQWLAEQGIERDECVEYLDYARGDPLWAAYLHEHQFSQLVNGFKPRLAAFLQGRIASSELCKEMLAGDHAITRRLLGMALDAYCFQACGIDVQGNPKPEALNPAKARELLALKATAEHQLLVEENNLDFQIQLEDVLISLKQILTRRVN